VPSSRSLHLDRVTDSDAIGYQPRRAAIPRYRNIRDVEARCTPRNSRSLQGRRGEARRKTGRGSTCARADTAARNKKSTKKCGAYIARSRIRNSRRNVTVRIDDYDDITLIWLLCIIRGIELAKDSPRDEGRGREGGTNSVRKTERARRERERESDWGTEGSPGRR